MHLQDESDSGWIIAVTVLFGRPFAGAIDPHGGEHGCVCC